MTVALPQAEMQRIVDEIRADLVKGFGGTFAITHPQLAAPLELRVIVDGATAWLVHIMCGERVIADTGHALCVHPDEFMRDLYVILVAALKAAGTPPARPS